MKLKETRFSNVLSKRGFLFAVKAYVHSFLWRTDRAGRRAPVRGQKGRRHSSRSHGIVLGISSDDLVLCVEHLRIPGVVLLMLLFVFALKGNDIVKKLWFTPAVFMLAYHVINIIRINEIIDFSYYFSIRLLLDICFPLFVTIAGLILTGLWLKNDSSESEATTAAMNSQAFSRTSVYSSAVSVADKLKAYKDLLDCGAITEEEFKAKKSELIK